MKTAKETWLLESIVKEPDRPQTYQIFLHPTMEDAMVQVMRETKGKSAQMEKTSQDTIYLTAKTDSVTQHWKIAKMVVEEIERYKEKLKYIDYKEPVVLDLEKEIEDFPVVFPMKQVQSWIDDDVEQFFKKVSRYQFNEYVVLICFDIDKKPLYIAVMGNFRPSFLGLRSHPVLWEATAYIGIVRDFNMDAFSEASKQFLIEEWDTPFNQIRRKKPDYEEHVWQNATLLVLPKETFVEKMRVQKKNPKDNLVKKGRNA